MKWTSLLTQRFPRPLLSAAIVSLDRHLAWAGILPLLQHQLWEVVVDAEWRG